MALEPHMDVVSHDAYATGTLESSTAVGSEPSAPLPIESDWAPIIEFTTTDIFQHSPFGDILSSLKYLSLSGEP